jgi:Co/Zn/Cd efflux system component
MGFATVQTAVAFIAKSEAMLGDSAAMAVDALTYGFNLYAEREKNQDEIQDQTGEDEMDNIELSSTDRRNAVTTDDDREGETERDRLERQFLKRRRHLRLELVPPLMSVSILVIVTIFVLRKSIHTLILDTHRNESEQARPNLELMMTFSTANLLLDVFNVTCFARAKHLMGYNTTEKSDNQQQYGEVTDDDLFSGLNDDNDESGTGTDPEEVEEDERVNLNMCSAYTHVFADTLRSIAVIIASIIAEVSEVVTPEVADATAAVIVSAIILLSLVPLFSGLIRTWRELRSIASEVKLLYDTADESKGQII